MALYVSLSVFSNLESREIQDAPKWNSRLLYRFKKEKNEQEWICSYRMCVKETQGKVLMQIKAHCGSVGTPSFYTVPNYLECCGILVSDDPSSACINSMLPDEVDKDGFHIFKWNAKPEVAVSLQESVQRFRGIIRDGKLELVELPLNDITWVSKEIVYVCYTTMWR